MSNSLKESKNSEKKESNVPEINEGEENEEEEKEDDIIDNSKIEKNFSNSNELNSNEGIKYIKKRKKSVKSEDKQIQNGNVISFSNISNDNQKNEKINADKEKDNKIKEYEENIKEFQKIIKNYQEKIEENEENIKECQEKNNEYQEKNKEYQEKIKILEKNIRLSDEREKTIQKLSKINLKLKNSLELISKQLDEKVQNLNLFKNKKNNNSNSIRAMGNLSKGISIKKDNKIISEIIIKEKELNNAVNMIKILRNDNERLQNKIDEIEKNKEIEKQTQDKKQIVIQRELQEHKVCKQKIEKYQEKIRKLTEKNKNLVDKIIYGKTKKGNYTNINNNFNVSSESDNDNGGKLIKIKKKIIKNQNIFGSIKTTEKVNLFNFKNLLDTRKQNNSLPRINFVKNQNLNSNKNDSNIININNIFNDDEMFQLNKVFSKNSKIYQIIIKKLEILQKSKDSIDNKYRLEQKQFTKRIYSMQQQIDYLNSKIRDSELKINILQAQLNESKLEKKQLLKRVKILSEGFEFNEFNTNRLDDNFNNRKENQKQKKNKKIKSNNNKFQDEISVDNSDFKGQKENNSIELGNEGDSIIEVNLSEETNKNKTIKLNKTNNDDSEDNSKYSNS